MVTAVNSHARLRSFLGWVVGFAFALSSLAVLHYQGVINVPSLEACQQKDIDPATGEAYIIPRFCSTGIFNDPNDLSMILVLGILFALYLMDSRQGIGRRPVVGANWFLRVRAQADLLSRRPSQPAF